jgi:hypothetical protein
VPAALAEVAVGATRDLRVLFSDGFNPQFGLGDEIIETPLSTGSRLASTAMAASR